MYSDKISIVYLWAELTGYIEGVLRYLGNEVDSVDVVHWDKRGNNSTRYHFGDIDNIDYHARSSNSDEDLLNLLLKRRPAIIVVSGWMDKGYIAVCRRYKRISTNVKIVAGIDDQWIGSMRQHLGRWYFRLRYRSIFDYMWVSGAPQFSYAQRFGYSSDKIIGNLYSADTYLFEKCASVKKRFIYVGRFIPVKGALLLLDAYQRLPAEIQREWPLVFIGDGELREQICSIENPNISVKRFLQPTELREELLLGGVACLPSHKDQWGVVVHEFSLLGLPMLLSSGVGAASEFLIPGFNGYLFESGSSRSLQRMLERFVSLAPMEFAQLGSNSMLLGSRINVEISAMSLLSVLSLN